MHAFDRNNCLRRFEKVNEILREFFDLRSEFYTKRKDYLQGMLEAEADKLSDQARFILEKCNNTLVVENKKRKTMIEELIRRGYKPDPVKEWRKKISMEEEEDKPDDEPEEEEAAEETSTKAKPKSKEDSDKAFSKLTDVQRFDYLLGMSMWMLTEERKNELLKQRDTKLAELSVLKAKTPHSLWVEDLDALEKKLNEVEKAERDEEAGTNKKSAKALAASSKAAATGRKRQEKKTVNDIYPSADGERVEFKVTEELLKKYEKLASAVSRKKERGEKATGGGDSIDGGGDELDALIEGGKKPVKKAAAPKAPKVPKEPKEPKVKKEKGPSDGLKQSKLGFKVRFNLRL